MILPSVCSDLLIALPSCAVETRWENKQGKGGEKRPSKGQRLQPRKAPAEDAYAQPDARGAGRIAPLRTGQIHKVDFADFGVLRLLFVVLLLPEAG